MKKKIKNEKMFENFLRVWHSVSKNVQNCKIENDHDHDHCTWSWSLNDHWTIIDWMIIDWMFIEEENQKWKNVGKVSKCLTLWKFLKSKNVGKVSKCREIWHSVSVSVQNCKNVWKFSKCLTLCF